MAVKGGAAVSIGIDHELLAITERWRRRRDAPARDLA
jgi:hypothetical protein